MFLAGKAVVDLPNVKADPLSVELGRYRLTLLNRLNASARNCSLASCGSENDLKIDVSTSA